MLTLGFSSGCSSASRRTNSATAMPASHNVSSSVVVSPLSAACNPATNPDGLLAFDGSITNHGAAGNANTGLANVLLGTVKTASYEQPQPAALRSRPAAMEVSRRSRDPSPGKD